jgi:hypothetical protein
MNLPKSQNILLFISFCLIGYLSDYSFLQTNGYKFLELIPKFMSLFLLIITLGVIWDSTMGKSRLHRYVYLIFSIHRISMVMVGITWSILGVISIQTNYGQIPSSGLSLSIGLIAVNISLYALSYFISTFIMYGFITKTINRQI